MPDVWPGEAVVLSGWTLLRVRQGWLGLQHGTLWLTDLRLVWSRSVARSNWQKEQSAEATVAIRLTHVEEFERIHKGRPFVDGLRISADGKDYEFYFRHPSIFFERGSTSSRRWVEALSRAQNKPGLGPE